MGWMEPVGVEGLRQRGGDKTGNGDQDEPNRRKTLHQNLFKLLVAIFGV